MAEIEITQAPNQTRQQSETEALPSQATNIHRPRQSISWGKAVTYLLLGFGALLAILPFLWMVSWSFMSAVEVYTGKVFPTRLMIENYGTAWTQGHFSNYMRNSAIISIITITGLLVFCIPAAYAFARMKFVGKNVLFGLMLATLMIPDIVTLIPNFLTVVWISRLSESIFGPAASWINNWPSLTIPFMASAFAIFLLRQFFAQLPEDLWDAARIDGAGHFRFLLYVVVPLSRAPIMTIVTFAFIGSWNSLLWPLLVVQNDNWRPVAFGLQKFVTSEAGDEFHLQMAASVIMIIPIIIIYFITQRQFTEGIASSGLKG
ncbi:MAG TPA: carbohydrate ABC transporter permease [Phototrophicaceae bacterium]|jgi:ABC-type glycerol-3-phosphate transport system permease component|nr:carbohydrate ABC transporter permease [Phototrophicaceae bacterium]